MSICVLVGPNFVFCFFALCHSFVVLCKKFCDFLDRSSGQIVFFFSTQVLFEKVEFGHLDLDLGEIPFCGLDWRVALSSFNGCLMPSSMGVSSCQNC